MESKPLTYNQRRLFADVMNHILANPKHWDQGHYHGTARNARVLDEYGDLWEMELNDEGGYSKEDWQRIRHCGTSHCFAGWVDILRGLWSNKTMKLTPKGMRKYSGTVMSTSVAWRARTELGIGPAFGEWLFCGGRTLDELYITCRAIVNGTLTQADIETWPTAWRDGPGMRKLESLFAKGVKRKTKLKAKPARLL